MKFSIYFFVLFSFSGLYGQEELLDDWDNILYISNKFGWGSESWRQTAEYQARLNNEAGSLEQWYLEYAAAYLISKNWELTPDFRFTRKPERVEYRPGFGAIYKQIIRKSQLVHQVKWQYDIRDGRPNSQGLRYAFFYNKVISEKFIATALLGGLFEFGKKFNGFLGLRAGVAAAYIFNKAHSINVGYFYGLINDKTNNYSNVGIFSIQLIINVRKDFKYLPAKYINL